MSIQKREMDVHLIHTTPNAERILSFAKDTRLLGDVGNDTDAFTPLQRMMTADKEDVMKNVEYSMNTIRGPLEFVHCIFLFLNASRAMTHQLVRHRVVSFAQQSLRVSDNFGFYEPDSIRPRTEQYELYKLHMKHSESAYRELIELGVSNQDARNVLPLATTSAIMMKINLRALLDMLETRLCLRVQGEHRSAMIQIKKLITAKFPWLKNHVGPLCETKGICAFPRYDCPVSKAVPELKGLSSDQVAVVRAIINSFGDKGLVPKPQKSSLVSAIPDCYGSYRKFKICDAEKARACEYSPECKALNKEK